MKIKLLTVVAAMVVSISAWAQQSDVYDCNGTVLSSNIPVVKFKRCGEDVPKTERRMYNFIDQDGRTVVKRASVLVVVRCEGGVCAEDLGGYFGEAMGTAPDGTYYVQRGYYLDRDSAGQMVAYRMGIGPQYDGRVAEADPAPNGLTGEACYDQKMAAFRQENGEEAMIIYDQINEWRGQCGMPLSE